MTDRRGFFAALGALLVAPALLVPRGPAWKRNAIGMPEVPGAISYVCYDGIRPTHLAMDRYCPRGYVCALGGIAVVGPELASGLPLPQDSVTINGTTFAAWKLG